ncbi:MAG: hypothetical protein ACFB11_09460 [Paracoccaceae bacterium]
MSDQCVPTLRRRFLEDTWIKRLQPKTQTMYLRAMRDFTRFPGHSPHLATPDELRVSQLDMKNEGVGATTCENRLTVRSVFFATTGQHPKMKRYISISVPPMKAMSKQKTRRVFTHPPRRPRAVAHQLSQP